MSAGDDGKVRKRGVEWGGKDSVDFIHIKQLKSRTCYNVNVLGRSSEW
jgi:hypothetical protein